jgi:hypothetical protein
MQHRRDAPYIFISYASADRERVLPLIAALERAGIPVWIDREGIHGGENYGEEIADAIERCAAFVLMTSAAALTSRNCKQEIALAWRYERTYMPLLLEPVTIPKEVAYWLEASQWIEVLDKPERDWLPQVLAALAPLGIVLDAPETVTLAGREREQSLLWKKLAAAKGGRGGLVLIGGEAGIGKTTLAEAAMREAAGLGFALLAGHCFDLAETPPYGPWVDLFLHVPPLAAVPLPEAFAVRGTVGVVPSQMALFAQVLDFFTSLGKRRPIALLLDDLHWSDPASLDVLRFLARSAMAMPLLILVAYRSDELTRRHPLHALLPQLAREAGAERIDLGRLGDAAVRALVRDRYALPAADTERLVDYLRQRAEGNALYVGELLRTLEEAGAVSRDGDGWRLGDLGVGAVPTLLKQVIEGRAARLDDEAQRLLAVAAVIGHEVPLALWAAMAESDEERILQAIERADGAGLLAETPDGLHVRFAHALVREALYEGLSPARRRLIHRRIAERLAEQPQPDPDAVAYHFGESGDNRASAWLVKAGERAQLAYAWLTAVERYEAALALLESGDGHLGERGWVRYRIARVRRAFAPRQAIEYLDEALRLATTVGDLTLTAVARYSRGLCRLYESDDYTNAEILAELRAGCDALEALSPDQQERLGLGPDEDGLPTITNVRGFLVAVLAGSGRVAEALAMGEVARDGKPRKTPLADIAWENYGDREAGLATAYALAGRPAEARAASERAAAHFREVSNYGSGNTIAMELLVVWLPYYADQPDNLKRLAEESEAAYRRLVSAFYERLAHLPLHALAGRWAQAREGAEVALRRTLGQRAFRGIAVVVLSDLDRLQGARDVAWAHISAMLPSGPETPVGALLWFIGPPLLRVAAGLALDAGDLRTAKAWLDAHDRWLDWNGAVLGQSEGRALWARYHRQAGDSETAREHAERALAHATEPRQPLALLAAHRLFGELDTEAGQYDTAQQHLAASLALADACEAPYERALTLLAMAELRAATDERDEAKRLLDDVRHICEPLGAKPALARADALTARLTDD